MQLRRRSALLVSGLLLAACGSTTSEAAKAAPEPAATATPSVEETPDAGPELDRGAPSDVYPAPHPEMPQVVNAGGPVLKTPRIVPIFFKGDPLKADIIDFASKVGSSKYWAATTAEYGVGAATVGNSIELTETPPAEITAEEVEDFLRTKLDGTHAEFGSIDANAIYTIYYPASTTIVLDEGGGFGSQSAKSCESFGGYHDSTAVGTKFLAYAVIPECPEFGGLIGIDAVTSTSSHEWIEAATDPHPSSDPAFSSVDADHVAWAFLLGGAETADMCAQDEDSFFTSSEVGYSVQRSWSNAAAKGSHDPCVPAASNGPYFNSAPVLPDAIKLDGTPSKGVKIPVGETRTIEVDLFSDGPTGGPWTVRAQALDFAGTKTLDIKLDRDRGQNGEKLYMTIKAVAASPYKASMFMISSRLGERRTSWVGIVAN